MKVEKKPEQEHEESKDNKNKFKEAEDSAAYQDSYQVKHKDWEYAGFFPLMSSN